MGVGGCLGAQARFGLSNWAAKRWGTTFPYGTLIINVSGSLLLGLFMALAGQAVLTDPAYRWLIAVGFCGGYTTFSTYCYETLTMLREGRWRVGGLANWLGSYLLGLAGAWLGLWLGSL